MANYANLLATIAANIYTNNNNEVTAAGVQAAVNAMVASLGAGYQFMGVAHPADTPSGYADLRAYWLASEAGIYTDFGGVSLSDGEVSAIKYDDNGWDKEILLQSNLSANNSIVIAGQTERGKYIAANGTITSGNNDYRVVYFQVKSPGVYWLRSRFGNSYPILAKYTGPDYSTLSSIISGSASAGINQLVQLSAGYYALSFDVAIGTPAIPSPYELESNEYSITFVDGLFEAKALMKAFEEPQITIIPSSLTRIERGKYIKENGVITTAGNDYRVAYFEMKKQEKRWLFSKYGNVHPILARYTDEACTILDGIVLPASGNINNFIDLVPGYYAFCWDAYTLPSPYELSPNEAWVLDVDPLLSLLGGGGSENKSFASISNKELTLSGSASISGGQVAVSGGVANRAYLDGGFECAHYDMRAKFRFTSGKSFVMGKDGATYGAFVEVYQNGANNKLKLVCDPGLNGGTIIEYDLGFSLNTDEDYVLSIQFDITTVKRWVIEIYGEFNEYAKFEPNQNINGYGNPFYYSNASAIVKEFSLSVQNFYDLRNARVAVWGHSFVEGDSLGNDRDKSFTNLLAQALGEDRVFNFGLGGDATAATILKMRNQLPFVGAVKYAMFCIGVNDGIGSQQIIANLQTLISIAESNGIIPILFTIEPKTSGFNASHRAVNSWIRSSGYAYVDMEQVFVDVDVVSTTPTTANIITSLYLDDGIHPTIEGHRDIFRRIQMDCPYLF